MYAHRLTPLQVTTRPEGHMGVVRRLSRAAPRARRRLVAFVLAATAVAAIGAGLLGRLGSDATHIPSRPPAPAEPGLFDFPQARQDIPPPVGTVLDVKTVSAPSAALPLHRVPVPASAPALPSGVERFDACMPACDSRDPARSGARLAPAMPVAPGTLLLPPLRVGEGTAARSEPGLWERTANATRDAVAGAADHMADQMKSLIGMK